MAGIGFCLAFLGCAALAFAETNAVPSAAPALPFLVGEELIYRIYWGIIPVGKTRIVSRWIEEDGRKLLAIRYRTRSNRFIAKLYPVDDIIEAVIDPATFLPVRFKIVLREGGHRRDEVTRFDYERLTAHWESRVKNKSRDFPIEKDTRDLVSFMYYMRSMKFQIGSRQQYRVMSDDKIYDLFIKASALESLKLSTFGSVASVKLEPTAAFDGLFKREGKMTVWVSQDERNIVTKIVGSVPIASIKVILSEVRGPGEDAWIVKTRKRVAAQAEDEDPEVEKALRELDESRVEPPLLKMPLLPQIRVDPLFRGGRQAGLRAVRSLASERARGLFRAVAEFDHAQHPPSELSRPAREFLIV